MKSCKKGYYYCNTDEKCKPIPEGSMVKPDGMLVKKDVSEENPNVVNQLLIKLADYYDEQVTPWFPAEENDSNPNNFDGVWKAWHM